MSGPTLVLIPSQLCTEAVFDPVLPLLRHPARIVQADQRSDDTIAAMAARLLAASGGPLAILGHGMGGFVALEAAHQAPGRIAGLALLDSMASADGPAQTERRLGYLRLVEAGRFAEVVRERVPILFRPEAQADPTLTGRAFAMAEAVGPEAFLRQQRAIMGRADRHDALGGLDCPILFLIGRQDAISSLAQQEAMRKSAPHARITVIADCGHMTPLERPAEVAAAIDDWLAAIA